MSRLITPSDWIEIKAPAHIAGLVPPECSVEAFKSPDGDRLAILYPAKGDIEKNVVCSLTREDLALQTDDYKTRIMMPMLASLFRERAK